MSVECLVSGGGTVGPFIVFKVAQVQVPEHQDQNMFIWNPKFQVFHHVEM